MLCLSLAWLHQIMNSITEDPKRAEVVIKVLDEEIENAETYLEVLKQYKAKAEYVCGTFKGQKELKL